MSVLNFDDDTEDLDVEAILSDIADSDRDPDDEPLKPKE